MCFLEVFEVTGLTRDSQEGINSKWYSEKFCPYTGYGDEGVNLRGSK